MRPSAETPAGDDRTSITRAAARLAAGEFVLLYDADGREEEIDLFVAAEAVTPARVRTLRRDAGGLVFLAVAPEYAHAFDLPFLQDMYLENRERHPVLGDLIPNDIAYDTRSSFSLTLNHRKTFTGITDADRALTISAFAETCRDAADLPVTEARRVLGARFRAPGHVHLCVGADGLLAKRQGHTELAVALAELAGVTPVVAGAEMLAPDGDGALSKKDALAWAEKHGAVLVDGNEVMDAWNKFNEARPVAALTQS
jgi:3,4-dihydroxy 2-butanone 4-phosphate synthase